MEKIGIIVSFNIEKLEKEIKTKEIPMTWSSYAIALTFWKIDLTSLEGVEIACVNLEEDGKDFSIIFLCKDSSQVDHLKDILKDIHKNTIAALEVSDYIAKGDEKIYVKVEKGKFVSKDSKHKWAEKLFLDSYKYAKGDTLFYAMAYYLGVPVPIKGLSLKDLQSKILDKAVLWGTYSPKKAFYLSVKTSIFVLLVFLAGLFSVDLIKKGYILQALISGALGFMCWCIVVKNALVLWLLKEYSLVIFVVPKIKKITYSTPTWLVDKEIPILGFFLPKFIVAARKRRKDVIEATS